MTRYEYVKTVLEPRFKDELYHYGTPRHSGRYPYGSGKRPFQGDPSGKKLYNKSEELTKEYIKAEDTAFRNNSRIYAELSEITAQNPNMSGPEIIEFEKSLKEKYKQQEYIDDMMKKREEMQKVRSTMLDVQRKARVNRYGNKPLSEMDIVTRLGIIQDMADVNNGTRNTKDGINESKALQKLNDTLDKMVKEYDTMGGGNKTQKYIRNKYAPKLNEIFEENAKEIINNLKDYGFNIDVMTGTKDPIRQWFILRGDDDTSNQNYKFYQFDDPKLMDDSYIADPSSWFKYIVSDWNWIAGTPYVWPE